MSLKRAKQALIISGHWWYLESLICLTDPMQLRETTTKQDNDVSLLLACSVLEEINHI